MFVSLAFGKLSPCVLNQSLDFMPFGGATGGGFGHQADIKPVKPLQH